MTVSSSKFTGAAAVAELWCRALRSAGFTSEMLFVRGENLEQRLRASSWGHALLEKERRPKHIRNNLAVLRSFSKQADVMMTFLPHDHFEAVCAGAHRRSTLVRVFRRPRHLRRDPLHMAFARRAAAAIAPFDALVDVTRTYMGGRPAAAFEVPVEGRFSPNTDPVKVRRELIAFNNLPIIGMVGKLAAGRGFGLLLEAAARLSHDACILVVGHGEHQPALEKRACALGLEGRIHWAGKREQDLPELYRVMDVVVFAAPGSDWGHRMITEAHACGKAVVAVDHPGVDGLVQHERSGLISSDDPKSVALAIDRLLGDIDTRNEMAGVAAQISDARRLEPVGRQIATFLEGIAEPPCCEE